jgi:exodeoxyribonuclease VII large subunit
MWNQLDLFSGPEHPYSVSEVTSRIRSLLEQEPSFQNLWIEGEVSNFSRASSGHCYFTLKDSAARISCVIWRSTARRLRYLPKSGDQVVAHGNIGLYEAGGRYQLYVDGVQPAGRGTLYQEYERLKAQLEAEGLFDPERKRALPPFPKRIGVVTSPTAAAFRDVLNVLRRRYPLVDVLLSPTLVQGNAAPPQIVAALDALNAQDDVDVILVVRGGGSLEDLWAFNDERVTRAVAASRIPIVSGVGHETDFSLADFAADQRAPTPSAAAEVATPDRSELSIGLSQMHTRLERLLAAHLTEQRDRIQQLQRNLQHLSPRVRLENARQQIDGLTAQMDAALNHRLDREQQHVQELTARLINLDPERVLQRGYTIVRERETEQILTSARQAHPNLALDLQMHDGEIPVRVETENEDGDD